MERSIIDFAYRAANLVLAIFETVADSAALHGRVGDIEAARTHAQRLQEKIAGRRLPDELLDPLRDVRVGFIGSGNFSWQWKPNVTLNGGVKFTRQVSSHSDLDWNGFNLIPRILFNMKFY